MAGHSKWANIKFRKERMDAKKSKTFGRLVRELTIASRIGGPDPESNPRLRLAIEKAKESNLPGSNVERAIKRGSGQGDEGDYDEVRYEGYGPGGTAFIVNCVTDNRNRCVAEVRRVFTRFGGSLASAGSVLFNFEHCGQFLFAPMEDDEPLAELCVEHDVLDMDVNEDGSIEVKTLPARFTELREALGKAGLEPDHAAVTMLPTNEVELGESERKSVSALLGELEALDDTDEVFTNAAMEA